MDPQTKILKKKSPTKHVLFVVNFELWSFTGKEKQAHTDESQRLEHRPLAWRANQQTHGVLQLGVSQIWCIRKSLENRLKCKFPGTITHIVAVKMEPKYMYF